jgi:hypothetical protein
MATACPEFHFCQQLAILLHLLTALYPTSFPPAIKYNETPIEGFFGKQ